MSTVAQDDSNIRSLQAKVSEETLRRIKTEAGRKLCTIGQVVETLVATYLPGVQADDEGSGQ